MYQKFRKARANLYPKCKPPQNDLQFEAYVKDDEYIGMVKPQDAIFLGINIETEFQIVKEEIRIYDEASLIGTVGGTLGLMIGFSFYGLIDLTIENFFAR